jgi:adenosylmethionine-8-amino-7-oxononanoate aminotransferase
LLAATLAPLAEHPLVKEVRSGLGLLGAVELHDSTKLAAVVAAARDRGVLTRVIRGVALQFSPPFVGTEDELAHIGTAVAGALDAVA